MALWFAGAASENAPRTFSSNHAGRKSVFGGITASTPCNAESTTVYRPHGRHHVPPPRSSTSDTVKCFGDFCIRSGDDGPTRAALESRRQRQAPDLSMLAHDTSPLTPRSTKPVAQPPFALGDCEAVPTKIHGQKRRVSPPHNNQRRGGEGEDVFVLKRSRTPPATERNRPKTEGFCVILGNTDRSGLGQATRENIVPLRNTGKGSFNWERTFVEERDRHEELVQRQQIERCRKARDRESVPPLPDRPQGRARAATPSSSRVVYSVRDPPFAINLPAPDQLVGMRSTCRAQTPRVASHRMN